MKQLNLFLIITFIASFSVFQAQEPVTTESKFNIITYGGIGYGKLENDMEPSYNLNSNNGHLLLNYKFNNKFGIASGVGYNQLSGNAFSSRGNFYHERELLKIPVLLTLEKRLVNNLRLLGNLGPYAQTVIKDEYRSVFATKKDVYEGWNFGFQIVLGFAYQLDEHLSVGLNLAAESDFTKLEANASEIVDDKQKMVGLNTIGILFIFDF